MSFAHAIQQALLDTALIRQATKDAQQLSAEAQGEASTVIRSLNRKVESEARSTSESGASTKQGQDSK